MAAPIRRTLRAKSPIRLAGRPGIEWQRRGVFLFGFNAGSTQVGLLLEALETLKRRCGFLAEP